MFFLFELGKLFFRKTETLGKRKKLPGSTRQASGSKQAPPFLHAGHAASSHLSRFLQANSFTQTKPSRSTSNTLPLHKKTLIQALPRFRKFWRTSMPPNPNRQSSQCVFLCVPVTQSYISLWLPTLF